MCIGEVGNLVGNRGNMVRARKILHDLNNKFKPLLYAGSVWISSELKGLHDDCEHFEWFPPGHLYSSKSSSFRSWYIPPWFCEAIPSIPYDPLILRRAFENVSLR